MSYVSTAINFVKDYYLAAVGWIAAHPHKTFWLSVGVTASRLVF